MKFNTLSMLVAAATAVQVKNAEGYNVYYEIADQSKPPIWSVVKRGGVRDFADANVEAAMKRNPSSG